MAAPVPLALRDLRRLESWNEFYKIARDRRFRNTTRLRVEVDKMRPAVKDLEPFLIDINAAGDYLVVRGMMLHGMPDGTPPLFFRVYFHSEFPERYPTVTIERPPPGSGFVIKNTANVDQNGTCYLHSVSQWSPPHSCVFNCMAELQSALMQFHPFVRGGPPPQQQQQHAPPQPYHNSPPSYPTGSPQNNSSANMSGSWNAAPVAVLPPISGVPPLGTQQQQQQHTPPPAQPQRQQVQPHSPAAAPAPQRSLQQQQQQQQQQPELRPAAPTTAPPPARSIHEVWAMVTTMVFTRAEAELLASGPTINFSDPAVRAAKVQEWCRDVLHDAVRRGAERGCSDGILLASGSVLKRDVLTNRNHIEIFDLVLGAQNTGEMRLLEQAMPLIQNDPDWKAKLANTVEILSSLCAEQQPGQPRPVPLEEVWKGFFSRAFAVGESAIARRDLTAQEVVDQEPFLYLGLTALTAFELVKRSPPSGPMRLALGERDLTFDNCPPEGRELLSGFMRIRDAYHAAHFSSAEENALRRAILLSGHDSRATHPNPQLRPDAMQIVAGLQSIAVHASQQPTFRENFSNVLQLLAACATA